MEVAQKGAAAIVVERDLTAELADYDITVIQVENSRLALACMSADYFGKSRRKAYYHRHYRNQGHTHHDLYGKICTGNWLKTGLIGTIETIIGEEHIPAANTTPESYIVQETFSKMVASGCQCVVMEVSSQGLMLHRVSGFTFDFGIFTNLSEDHINLQSTGISRNICHARPCCFSSAATAS